MQVVVEDTPTKGKSQAENYSFVERSKLKPNTQGPSKVIKEDDPTVFIDEKGIQNSISITSVTVIPCTIPEVAEEITEPVTTEVNGEKGSTQWLLSSNMPTVKPEVYIKYVGLDTGVTQNSMILNIISLHNLSSGIGTAPKMKFLRNGRRDPVHVNNKPHPTHGKWWWV